jgi:hypothetical protein
MTADRRRQAAVSLQWSLRSMHVALGLLEDSGEAALLAAVMRTVTAMRERLGAEEEKR